MNINNTKTKPHLISLDELKKKNFTKKELDLIEKKSKILIAVRKIKEERELRNLTQFQAAKLAGIPRTTLSKIESGYQNVSILKLMQVASAMDMDVEINLVPRKKSKKLV